MIQRDAGRLVKKAGLSRQKRDGWQVCYCFCVHVQRRPFSFSEFEPRVHVLFEVHPVCSCLSFSPCNLSAAFFSTSTTFQSSASTLLSSSFNSVCNHWPYERFHQLRLQGILYIKKSYLDYRQRYISDTCGVICCCSKSSEEILEGHIRDLQKQISQRDNMIEKLRNDIFQLNEEHKTSVDQVILIIIIICIYIAP